ncbi:MAG: DUF3187 family protein [Candidatus Omnitrophica bacterium]|nr:DUF3187 family protein [Candidatus Omnitrophota bacterium]
MRICKIAIMMLLFCLMLLYLGENTGVAELLGEEDTPKQRGPISIRNQMPLYLFYLQMVPDKADVTKRNRFTINADYTVSNITVSAFTPVTSLYEIEIDMEVSRVTLDFRYGLYDNLEIGLEVPYLDLSRGYLDNPIEAFEDGTGARTPRSRERQGSYNFEYTFRYNYKYYIRQTESTEGLGDIVLNAKYQLLKEGRFWPNISMRSAIKFPTAEKDDFLGSGEVDYGVGLLIDKGFFGRLFIYTGGNIAFIEKPSFFSEIGIDKEILSFLLALEFFVTERFSLVTQVTGNTTPYPYSNTNPLDNKAYDMGVGFNYTWKEKSNISWRFAVFENISAASSPDVSLKTGLSWKF